MPRSRRGLRCSKTATTWSALRVSLGHFLVYTAPGTYVVVPDEPIGFGSQHLAVTVGMDGLTHVDLLFDTGIR
jgi:hypothetical protein